MFLKDLNAQNIAAYYETLNEDKVEQYLGSVLFPARKKIGIDLSWVKGINTAPVTLKPSAFDTDVTLRDRLGVEIAETEMPLFKEAMLVKEKERQELLTLSQHPNKQMYNMVLNNIFNDKARLIDSAEVNVERMRMQLITQGKIVIDDNKVLKEYDYGFDYDNNLIEFVGDDAWDKDGSDPIDDLVELVDNAPVKPSLMIVNRRTLGMLRRNKAVKEYLGYKEGTKAPVKLTDLTSYIQDEVGLRVVVYDKQYTDKLGGEVKKFIPDGVVSLVPESIGNTWYGTTPEEADLMAGIGTSAQVSIVNTGTAVTVITKDDPVNIVTKVSDIVLPSAENLDGVFILQVTETEEETPGIDLGE